MPAPATPLRAVPDPSTARTSWTADELMATQFPPPRWAVPGLIAEGVTLLAGPPKIGKSWLALGLAIAVAGAGKALDGIPTDTGDVLYLALEDTGRRLKRRLGVMLADDDEPPKRLTLSTACPTLNAGGEEKITTWLDTNPGARLIIIDVLARIRPTMTTAAMSAYDADYAAIRHVKRIADTYRIPIIVVHHVRKAASDDFLTEVSGTNGLAGAADTVMVLKRSRGDADGVLHVTGRDVDENDYALRFLPAAGAWILMDGPPEDHTLPETRAAILRYLRDHPGGTPKAIADATGLSYDNVKRTAARMAGDGQLIAGHAGHYQPPTPGDSQGDSTGDTNAVPPVPAVPQPTPTSTNGRDSPPPDLSPLSPTRSDLHKHQKHPLTSPPEVHHGKSRS